MAKYTGIEFKFGPNVVIEYYKNCQINLACIIFLGLIKNQCGARRDAELCPSVTYVHFLGKMGYILLCYFIILYPLKNCFWSKFNFYDCIYQFGCGILKMVDPKKEEFLAKNQYTQRKPLHFENTGSTSS